VRYSHLAIERERLANSGLRTRTAVFCVCYSCLPSEIINLEKYIRLPTKRRDRVDSSTAASTDPDGYYLDFPQYLQANIVKDAHISQQPVPSPSCPVLYLLTLYRRSADRSI
jgi:hypothetical protein